MVESSEKFSRIVYYCAFGNSYVTLYRTLLQNLVHEYLSSFPRCKISENMRFQDLIIIYYAHDCSPIFKDLQVLKLMDNVKINNCLFVHDYLNNFLPNLFAIITISHCCLTCGTLQPKPVSWDVSLYLIIVQKSLA